MSHYDTLGLERNATPQQIKAAYRRKASKHHSDRAGGSDEEMKAINMAYQTLSDPEMRKHYDETGSDNHADRITDQEVFDVLRSLMASVISHSELELPALSMMRRALTMGKVELEGRIKTAEDMKRILEQRRKRVYRKDGGPGIFEELFAVRIHAEERTLAKARRAIQINERALAELEGYEEKEFTAFERSLIAFMRS